MGVDYTIYIETKLGDKRNCLEQYLRCGNHHAHLYCRAIVRIKRNGTL
jgi:hypothetical protein